MNIVFCANKILPSNMSLSQTRVAFAISLARCAFLAHSALQYTQVCLENTGHTLSHQTRAFLAPTRVDQGCTTAKPNTCLCGARIAKRPNALRSGRSPSGSWVQIPLLALDTFLNNRFYIFNENKYKVFIVSQNAKRRLAERPFFCESNQLGVCSKRRSLLVEARQTILAEEVLRGHGWRLTCSAFSALCRSTHRNWVFPCALAQRPVRGGQTRSVPFVTAPACPEFRRRVTRELCAVTRELRSRRRHGLNATQKQRWCGQDAAAMSALDAHAALRRVKTTIVRLKTARLRPVVVLRRRAGVKSTGRSSQRACSTGTFRQFPGCSSRCTPSAVRFVRLRG